MTRFQNNLHQVAQGQKIRRQINLIKSKGTRKSNNLNRGEFEDTKGVIRIRKSKKDRQHNEQKKKDKQQSSKHYTDNERSSNTNPT